MGIIDMELYEQKFNIKGNLKPINLPVLDFIMNMVLNSIELTNTKLKLSDKECKSNLLSFSVKSIKKYPFSAEFFGTYCVSDGEIYENRTLEGSLVCDMGCATLCSKITRLNGEVLEVINLLETFEVDYIRASYCRVSQYSNSSEKFVSLIANWTFEKAERFRERKLTLMREGDN